MKTKTFTAEQIIEHYKEHRNCVKTATHFGVSHTTIRKHLKKANIRTTKVNPKEVIEHYKEHKNTAKTAKHFGISSVSVLYHLKKANIKIFGRMKVMCDNEIIKKYKDGGTIHGIAKKYSVSASVIKRILESNNITLPKKRQPIDQNEIIKKYKDGKNFSEIYRETTVSIKTIKKILKLNNVEIPKRYAPIKVLHDDIVKAALKYKHRSDFERNDKRCYKAAMKRKILDDVCSHMEPLGDLHKRLVYVYEFEDNHVYVGLTSNKNRRDNEHHNLNNSPVCQHIQKTGLTPKYTMVSDYYISVIDAQKLEKMTIKKYKENGWFILNKRNGGEIGSITIKWTEEVLRKEALKYNTKSEMRKNSLNAYSAIMNKKLQHLFSHMKNNTPTLKNCTSLEKKFNYNLQTALEISKKYTTLDDFKKNDFRAYRFLKNKKDYLELTKHLKRSTKKTKYEYFIGSIRERMTVLSISEGYNRLQKKIKFKCECGNVKEVPYKNFCAIKSCGCTKKKNSVRNVKHNMSSKKNMEMYNWYKKWDNMISRCYNPKNSSYKHAGAKGIIVCDRWREPNGKGLENYLNDVHEILGPRPSPKHSLRKIKNSGNYEISNLMWMTFSEQTKNQRKI